MTPEVILAQQSIARRASTGMRSSLDRLNLNDLIAALAGAWGYSPGELPNHRTEPPLAVQIDERVRDIDAALAKLEGVAGERADAARAVLTDRRAAISAPLARMRAILPGSPKLAEMRARLAQADHEVAAAEVNLLHAAPEEARAAREAIDRAQAAQRETEREIIAYCEPARAPRSSAIPAFDVFADTATQQIAMLAADPKQKFQALALAIDSARDAAKNDPLRGALHIVSEQRYAKPSAWLKQCFETRAALYAELTGR